jgi:plasmid replication initiation protein
MMKFKSIYSYRIYEMILGRIGYEDGRTKVKRDKYYFTYGLSQLKYQLGVLDPYINADVRKALTEARTEEDFERIEKSLSDEHTMMRFSDFETYTLARAMKEINGLQDPDYIFDYEPTRSGRGGRITEVNFIITRVEKNTKTETEKFKLSEEEKDEILDRISDLIDEPLKLKDIRAIAETADYDFDKVKAAYEIAEGSSADIENLVGFLKSAIKNGYEKPVSKKAKKSTFVDIDADEIDYDEIAKRKIDRQFNAV